MSLITVHLGLVSPYGSNDVPLVASGRVTFTPVSHGKYEGAFRTIETVNSPVVQGVMTPVELTPGIWSVLVSPTKGNPWPETKILLEEGMEEPVNIVNLYPDEDIIMSSKSAQTLITRIEDLEAKIAILEANIGS